MRRILFTVVCLLSLLSAHAQTASKKDFLTIREAMDIVSYRRQHVLDESGFDGFIEAMVKKYDYREQDFLEGIGTCSFWQYVKNGHTVIDTAPDDYFVPDDIRTAATVAVTDCEGIETIVGDETAIDVDLRVFSEDNFNILMREMQDMGFKYQKTENGLREYAWQSYRVYVHKSKTRGHDCWTFQITLTKREYDTTKHVEFDDSTRLHNLTISLDYPVKGDPTLLRRIRTFMMEAIVVGENDYYISCEVLRYGFYGGTDNYLVYGATFRKSDGKRLHVIANPKNPQYRQFLNKDLYIEERDALLDEYKNHIPLPEYEPYLIQDGVRFVYQQGEIAVRPAGFIRTEASYPVMRPFLTDEVKDLLK